MVASKQRNGENGGDGSAPDSMEALEASGGTKVGGFVRAKKTEPKVRHPDAKDGEEGDAAANPDEIEISDGDSDDEDAGEAKDKNEDDDDDEEDVNNVKKKSIPDAVFGSSLADKAHAEQEEEKLGAKERFKRIK